MSSKAWVALLAILSINIHSARADVKVPAVFADHMVLQRDQPLKFWGWADPQ
ncbi:MAG: hypothetical protein ACK480_14385 [Planctomycetota bacterium]